jgi:ATP-binding cassette subfamily B multidrug efflux pump
MAILNFARRYATRYLHWYAAGALMLVITNWLAVTIPLYLADGIDALDRGQPSEVPRIAGLVVLMGAVLVGVRTGSRLLFFTPGRLVEAEVKRDLFARLLDHQPAFVRRFAPADVISRASSDVNNIRLLAGFGVLQLLNAATALTLTGVQMVRISPELALWVLAPVGVGLVVTQAAIGRMFILIRRMQVQLASLSDHILSTYQGVATVQGFVAQGAFLDRFDGLNSAHLKTSLERANLRTAIGPVLAAAGSVNVFLLLYIGGPMAVRGEISVGQLVAFTTLIAYLVNPLRSVSFLLAIVKEAQASIERATEILDPPADRPDLPAPLAVPSAPPRIDIRGLTFDRGRGPLADRRDAVDPSGGHARAARADRLGEVDAAQAAGATLQPAGRHGVRGRAGRQEARPRPLARRDGAGPAAGVPVLRGARQQRAVVVA